MSVQVSTAETSVAQDLPRRRWNWQRDLNYFLLAIGNILWLMPLYQILNFGIDEDIYPKHIPTNLAWISVMVMVALFIRRWMIQRKITSRPQLIVMLMGITISLLAILALRPIMTGTSSEVYWRFADSFSFTKFTGTFPPGIIYLTLVASLWWRSFAIGRSDISPANVSYQLRLGILLYFFLAIIGTRAIRDVMLTLLPLFFFVMLMATTLARASVISRFHDATSHRLTWRNIASLGLISLTTVTFSFIFSVLLSGLDRDYLAQILEYIWLAIAFILLLIFTPFFWLAQQILTAIGVYEAPPIEFTLDSGQREPPGKASDNPQIDLSDVIEGISAFISDNSIYLGGVFVGAMIIFWLVYIFGADDHLLENEEHDKLENREVAGNLRKSLQDQFKRLAEMLGLVRNFGVGRGLVGALTVRWAYARMEREAKKRGFPREKSQTPYEYRRNCYRAYPQCDAEVKLITEAYVAIRYGELPETDEDLDHVRQALDTLMDSPTVAL